MKTVALISGGKDSCYNVMQCIGAGHKIVALANLQPQLKDELDSYMYQTVGHQGIELYAEAMGLPLYREVIKGEPLDQGYNYVPTENDEVEDLYNLLLKVKNELDIEAVAVGAILSDYQRVRVENVCQRLGLVSLAYLWRRNQKELLQEMIASGVEAVIIKVAALGLDPNKHLGLTLSEIQPHLLLMKEKYGLNVCGEGGEYETFTLDCPIFKKRLVIDKKQLVIHTCDPVAPVGYLNLKLHLEPKENVSQESPPTVKKSSDFVGDLSDSVFSDISDLDLSEAEIDSMEKIVKEEKIKEVSNQLVSCSELIVVDSSGSEAHDESADDGFSYEKLYSEYERQPVLDHSSIYVNNHGWYFIGGIVGEGFDIREATMAAMKKLISLLESASLRPQDVCSVNLYIRDMNEYSSLNEIYVQTFDFPNPPTRVCVQCPLPDDTGLIMDAVAYKSIAQNVDEADDTYTKERITMHVQSISHWAPANIGPYSQAFKVGEVIGTCGQIALVPGTMQLVEGGASKQCALALRHLTRVIRAINSKAHIRSVVQSVCYTTKCSSVRQARGQLEARTAGSIVQCAVVGALPRGAQSEWHAWAHAHNNQFEYEETGCNVGDYKVAITRRWNYENTVAAFVCYVATGSSPSTCQLQVSNEALESHSVLASSMDKNALVQVLDYALRKLLDCPADTAVKMRIFYQVWSAPPISMLVEAVNEIRTRLRSRVSATLVPVLALHNAYTFLSISGLRLDE